ncbi:uncharacterized protein BXIN_1606 [Babesia sp. Xinjiang]|uniref:uncharacterized protein n=1 Tax=Babesia sp. Xinjiang TaxID=462227 RepID=UPI000A2538F6|nr:uncharacterized protein BXIN_1606 [Babesia sp. Xinjiang]ORM42169.1 hypothetical protein BXIN_1606 [Babesia sp. Xinjiang]
MSTTFLSLLTLLSLAVKGDGVETIGEAHHRMPGAFREQTSFEKLKGSQKICVILGILIITAIVCAIIVGIVKKDSNTLYFIIPAGILLLVGSFCASHYLGPTEVGFTKEEKILGAIGLLVLFSICGLTIFGVSRNYNNVETYFPTMGTLASISLVALVIYSAYIVRYQPFEPLLRMIFGVSGVLLLSGCIGLAAVLINYHYSRQPSGANASIILSVFNVVLLVAVLYFAYRIGLLDSTVFNKDRSVALGYCIALVIFIGLVVALVYMFTGKKCECSKRQCQCLTGDSCNCNGKCSIRCGCTDCSCNKLPWYVGLAVGLGLPALVFVFYFFYGYFQFVRQHESLT